MRYQDSNLTIQTTDFDRIVSFYVQVLGFRLKYRDGDRWAEAVIPGLTLGFIPGAGSAGAATSLSLGLGVETLREAMAELESRGVLFPSGIRETEVAYLAPFSDPESNQLYLFELRGRS